MIIRVNLSVPSLKLAIIICPLSNTKITKMLIYSESMKSAVNCRQPSEKKQTVGGTMNQCLSDTDLGAGRVLQSSNLATDLF